MKKDYNMEIIKNGLKMLTKKTNNMKIKNQHKKGVTLVELLIVIAVAAVIIAGALAIVGNVQRNASTQEETTNLTSLYQNIDGYFRRGTTTSLDNSRADAAGFIPGGMFIEDDGDPTVIANSFGGYVEIEGAGTIATNTRGFSVEYTRIPQAACVNMVQNQVSVGWDQVSIEGSEVTAPAGTAPDPLFMFSTDGTGGTRGNQPLNEIEIIENCDVAENYVRIVLVKDSDV